MSKDDILNDDDDSTTGDSLLWSRDLEKHSFGEFSFAVVQANEVIEDHSQVESGRDATFIGVYDGHGGPDASRFISDHLFLNLMSEFFFLLFLLIFRFVHLLGC
jgi:pyruvate dehydrogenase phosphatase